MSVTYTELGFAKELDEFIEAARDGACGDAILQLLNRGKGSFTIDSSGEDGQTALHAAAAHGHEATVSSLLRSGADCNIR